MHRSWEIGSKRKTKEIFKLQRKELDCMLDNLENYSVRNKNVYHEKERMALDVSTVKQDYNPVCASNKPRIDYHLTISDSDALYNEIEVKYGINRSNLDGMISDILELEMIRILPLDLCFNTAIRKQNQCN